MKLSVRRALLAVACLAIASGVFVVPSSDTSTDTAVVDVSYSRPLTHDTDLPNVISWNMCNGISSNDACLEEVGSEKPAAALEYSIALAQRRPRLIALQEICLPAYLRMVYSLGEFNYHAHFYTSNPNPQTGCVRHGNAVFWKGGCDGDCWHDIYYPDAGESDLRGAACAESDAYGFVGCSTHLNSGTPSVAINQQYLYRQYGNQVSQFQTFYGAGDFNMVPTQSGMSGWAGWATNYVEGGSSCFCRFTYESAGGTTKKLDYIWATENPPQNGCTRSHDANILSVLLQNPTERVSDHYQYRAYFNC